MNYENRPSEFNPCYCAEPYFIEKNVQYTDFHNNSGVRYYNHNDIPRCESVDLNLNQNNIYAYNAGTNRELNESNFICTSESWKVLLLIPIVLLILGIILGIALGIG